MYLSWSEGAWWIKDDENILMGTRMLGEARNVHGSLTAMRVGDEVLVHCDYSIPKKTSIIDANMFVSGFGEDLDGKKLKEIMKEDKIYNYTLRG